MPTFGDLRRYVVADGWTPSPNRSRNRKRQGDHDRYEKPQPSAPALRTKVSKHANEEIGDDLFRRILREQLKVDEETFWAMVRRQAKMPESSTMGSAPPAQPGKPGWLVALLIGKLSYTAAEIEVMTLDEARGAWEFYQATGTRQ